MPSLVSPKVTGPSVASITISKSMIRCVPGPVERHGAPILADLPAVGREPFIPRPEPPQDGPLDDDLALRLSDRCPLPAPFRPEIDAVDVAVSEPARPLMGMVAILARDVVHGIGPGERFAGRADDGEEDTACCRTSIR